MIARPRSLLLVGALAAGVAASFGGPLEPAGAQDATTTTVVAFGGAPTQATDPAVTETTIATGGADATAEPEATQTITEGTSEERSLLTESRKVLATIAGLVIAAIGLALLTIRYWRATKPVKVDSGLDDAPATGSRRPTSKPPVLGTEAALPIWTTDAPMTVPSTPLPIDDLFGPPTSPRAVAGADHARADDDWEPRGTGEHDVIVVPPPPSPRPSAAARAAALGLAPDPEPPL